MTWLEYPSIVLLFAFTCGAILWAMKAGLTLCLNDRGGQGLDKPGCGSSSPRALTPWLCTAGSS
jgi:hypothetical protein